MKLNLEIILDNITQKYCADFIGLQNMHLLYDRPRMFHLNGTIQKGRIYIVSSHDLPQLTSTHGIALIIAGKITEETKTSLHFEIPALHILSECDPFVVWEEIQDIFDKYDDWERALQAELQNDNGIDMRQILRLGVEKLCNSIHVSNQNLQIIFAANVISEKKEKLTIEVTDTPYSLPYESNLAIKEVCQKEMYIRKPYTSALRNSYCNNLYPMGHFAGCVAVIPLHRPFRSGDYALANHFFYYFQKAFLQYLKYTYPAPSFENQMFQNLFQGKLLSEHERERLSILPSEKWVFFKLKECPNIPVFPCNYLHTMLTKFMPENIIVYLFQEKIAGLLKITDTMVLENNKVIDNLGSILSQMGYVAVLSMPFTNISQIRDYEEETDFVYNQIMLEPKPGEFYSFKDYRLSYILFHCHGNLPLEELYSNGISLLAEYDKEKNAELVKTLDIYLECESNLSKASDLLFLHRSSLLKRLKKIEMLLHEDLSNVDTRLYYRICLKLLKNT